MMNIRLLEPADIPQWIQLRCELWPHESRVEMDMEGRVALMADPPLIVRWLP